MYMHKIAKIGAASLLAMLTGCAYVQYTSPGMTNDIKVKGVEGRKLGDAVMITTTGYYFIWTVPLVSGDLRWDDEAKSIKGGFRLFRDQVDAESMHAALYKIAETRNCDLTEVYLHHIDSTYAGVSSMSGLIGALFGSSEMCLSAVLVPRDSENGSEVVK